MIRTDIPRTFPNLKIFHEGGPLHDALVSVIQAYVEYRPDVGYVQGMSYLASILLLNLDQFEAFVALANLLNRELYFNFFRMDVSRMRVYMDTYAHLLRDKLPKVDAALTRMGVSGDMYLFEWLLTVYSRSLALDIAHRIWDNFLLHGPVFLFRTALAILSLHANDMVDSWSFEQTISFLNRPGSLVNDEDRLFAAIDKVSITPARFGELLGRYRGGA